MQVIKFLYMLPGTIMLWVIYMNPKGGFEGVAKSGRNYRSPVFTFLTATAFWVFAFMIVVDEGIDIDFPSSKSTSASARPFESQAKASRPTSSTVKSGGPSSSASTAQSSSASTAQSGSGSSDNSACERAKKEAAQAGSMDEFELAKAKVESLC